MSSGRGSFGYDSYGSYSDGRGGGGSGGRDSSNDFTRLSQSVSNNIQKITQNVNQLQVSVNKIGTQQDTPELRDKLHQLQHYTNQLAKDTSTHLKELTHLPQPQSQSEKRQRTMLRERLMNDFSKVLNNFQAAQRQAAQKEKESVARARAQSTGAYDPFQEDARKTDANLVDISSSPQDRTQMQAVAMEEDVDLQLIQEREQAIRQLEADITDVNQIFKDLGVLVHEQGEMIDSIESNVEMAAVHVEEGTSQLSKAREYQSKARKKKCIIILILVIVLAVLATILGVTLSNKN